MKKNGFTLIELIISIVLVGIILASMIGTLMSLKNTYGVINEDVEARTYSALISKVINEHIMKNNGIKNYTCSDTECDLTLGTNKEMILEIKPSKVSTSDMKDASTGDIIGSLVEEVTTIKYYDVAGGYSYYKTIKHYDKKYNSGETIELGYKFNKLSGKGYEYESKKGPNLKDYLVNITVEMNDPKYNIEIYATSLTDDTEAHHRLYTLTYNSNGGLSCIPNTETAKDGEAWGELCVPTRDGYRFKGWFIQPSGQNVIKVTSATIAIEDITVYAHWDDKKYSCSSGNYLKAGDTSCSICLEDHYCPGITDVFYDEEEDQGIYPCLNGYHSPAGSSLITACKIACQEDHYIKIANDSSCTQCDSGYISSYHEVIQGDTSSCFALPNDKPTISGGKTIIYGSGNVILTCTPPSSYGDASIQYQFGYSDSFNGTISTWSSLSSERKFTVDSMGFVGNRYYACKITSSRLTSDASIKTLVKITNASILFDANGGWIRGHLILYARKGSSSLYNGDVSSVSGAIPTAIKTGYNFDGWYSSDSGKVYNKTLELQKNVLGYTDSNPNWIVTKNKILYAFYSPQKITIRYDCNDGSTSATQEVYYNSQVTIKGVGADSGCKIPGKMVNAWVDPTGDDRWTGWSGTWGYLNGQYGIVDNTLVLTATYIDKPVYIYYNKNGKDATVESDTYSLNGELISKDGGNTSFYQPWSGGQSKDLYNFSTFGLKRNTYYANTWCTNSNGSGTCFDQNTTFTYDDFKAVANSEEDTYYKLDLYAKWVRKPVRIYYNRNGGTVNSTVYSLNGNWISKDGGNTSFYQTIKYNSENDPYNLSTFGLTKSGYKASNWCTESDGSGTCFDQNTDYSFSDYKNAKKEEKGEYYKVVLYPKWLTTNICQCNYYYCYSGMTVTCIYQDSSNEDFIYIATDRCWCKNDVLNVTCRNYPQTLCAGHGGGRTLKKIETSGTCTRSEVSCNN